MENSKTHYQIVGRYMNGKEVVAYHLMNIADGTGGRFTKDQIAFLIGKGQITNADGQLYRDKFILRGIGTSIESLPVKQEDGGMSRISGVGKIRRGDTPEDIMNKLNVTATVVDGRNVVGYVVVNSGGGRANISRDKTFELAKAGKLGNIRYQESNGKPILRGVGIDMRALPTYTMEEVGLRPPSMKNTPDELRRILLNNAIQSMNSAIAKLHGFNDNDYNIGDIKFNREMAYIELVGSEQSDPKIGIVTRAWFHNGQSLIEIRTSVDYINDSRIPNKISINADSSFYSNLLNHIKTVTSIVKANVADDSYELLENTVNTVITELRSNSTVSGAAVIRNINITNVGDASFDVISNKDYVPNISVKVSSSKNIKVHGLDVRLIAFGSYIQQETLIARFKLPFNTEVSSKIAQSVLRGYSDIIEESNARKSEEDSAHNKEREAEIIEQFKQINEVVRHKLTESYFLKLEVVKCEESEIWVTATRRSTPISVNFICKLNPDHKVGKFTGDISIIIPKNTASILRIVRPAVKKVEFNEATMESVMIQAVSQSMSDLIKYYSFIE